jgi:D,D-heptose 1,7-bisphosphate phosphatase
MGNLAKDIPKPMIRLAGKPLLEYHIEWLRFNGFKEVWLIINHLGNVIEDYFGNGEHFGLYIRYFHEAYPMGTVGGIKALENELKEDFLVLYGDVMLDMDFQRLQNFHLRRGSQATLVVHPNDHPHDSDLVRMDADDRIIAFLPKPHDEGVFYQNMVNAAMYIFSPDIFTQLTEGQKADFGKDIFPNATKTLRMYGYNTPEYIKDMGTPGRLEEVTRDLLNGKIARRNLKNLQKAIFLDRDGVINADKGLICRHEDFELLPKTAKAVKAINQSEYLAIVVTNQPGIAKGMYSYADLEVIHSKMDTLLGNEGAKTDALYFCPHHPDKGFPGERAELKIVCTCRKPASGMLLQAAEDFNIDLKQSFIIGDHERDIIAGRNVGCTTIGVETGHALAGSSTIPDKICPDLQSAVQWILKNE